MDKPPALRPDDVQAFVISAHGDLERVRAWLDRAPQLVNAAWDWDGGDWETALGGAAHMGRLDIAHSLIERGARIDIFAAAMLGELGIVKAVIEAYPGLANAPGPHGIPLLAQARAGGDGATAVVDYLTSLAAIESETAG